MTVEEDNVALLREAYARWAETKAGPEGIEHWLGLMSEDIQFQSLGEGADALPFCAPKRGPGEVRGYIEGLAAEWEMVSFEVTEFIAQGDRVVALIRCAFRCRRSGNVAHSPKADVWRIRDGKAVAFFEYFDTACLTKAAQC